MSDYGTLIARVNAELSLPQVAARIPDAIQAAIRFYENERLWFTESESTASTVANQQNYAMPTDLVKADVLTLTDNDVRYRLSRKPWNWLRRRNLVQDEVARPYNWAHYDEQLWLLPIPDQVYTLTMSYLQRLAALSAFTDTNAWMTHGEELVRNRVKHDLLMHPAARDLELAAFYDGRANQALSNLRSKSEDRVATERLAMDDSLVHGYNTYNVNYE